MGLIEDADDDISTTTEHSDESLVVQNENKVMDPIEGSPIEVITVTATSQNDDAVTTITESVASDIDEIDKDYFFNTKGILKKPSVNEDPLWADRKEKVREAIDSILKDK